MSREWVPFSPRRWRVADFVFALESDCQSLCDILNAENATADPDEKAPTDYEPRALVTREELLLLDTKGESDEGKT